MSSLSKKVWERIRTDFEPTVHAEITEALNLYEDNERERVQLHILLLAKGSKAEVVELVKAANQDYRNIIYWAENQNDLTESKK